MTTNPNLVPVFIETTGAHRGREHSMPYGEHVLGRGRGASVALDDPDVSRQHARIIVEPDGLTVFDLGSKNGVRVRGCRVDDAVSLRHGEELKVGEVTLRLQHPAAQVAQALAAAGEATATLTNSRDDREVPMMSVLWPVVGVVAFATAVALLLLV